MKRVDTEVIRINSFFSEAGKVEVALAIEDMASLKVLVATDTVAVLTDYNIGTRTRHRTAYLYKTGRGVLAHFFCTVIENNYSVGALFGFSYIVECVDDVKGTRSHSVFKRIRIFVFADRDEAYLLAALFNNKVFSGVVVILSEARIGEYRVAQELRSCRAHPRCRS